MADAEQINPQDSVQESLQRVLDILQQHNLAGEQGHQNSVETLVYEQRIAQLRTLLDELHPADVAHILEALPLDERLIVWELVKAERDGDILLEVSDAVRETLIATMDSDELLAAAETLDTDELADLAPDLPHDVMQDLLQSLDALNRARLQSALSYPEDAVGGLMDFDMVTLREDITLEVALRYLRRMGELPDHTDKLFIVDREEVLIGVLPLKRLLIHDPDVSVAAIMVDDPMTLHPDDDAQQAAQAFERYNLVSAPVVDRRGKLVGRVTVDAVMDFIREESDSEILGLAGLREEEDLFASVWKSVKNRWMWLAVNLVTAFIASRVISLFQGSIAQLVVLAALMPIVAGIGGNSGNQTLTMIVRALALGQLRVENARKLLFKELGVSLLNGVIWGGLIGLLVYFMERDHSLALAAVMTTAMILNLLLAAIMGVLIPLLMHKLGRDPAVGSSVMITAITDSGGFFIFLGLATIFLL